MAERVPLQEGLFSEDPKGERMLLGNKCASCGQIFFPKARLCLECGHEELSEVKLSRRGTLYSYTIGHMPSLHFQPPYAIGYIDLPEKVRIFAPLEMTAESPFEVGMEMDLIIDKLWEDKGNDIIGYKFKPV